MTASEKLAALNADMKDSECYHRSDDEWAAATACALYRGVLPELVALVAAVEAVDAEGENGFHTLATDNRLFAALAALDAKLL